MGRKSWAWISHRKPPVAAEPLPEAGEAVMVGSVDAARLAAMKASLIVYEHDLAHMGLSGLAHSVRGVVDQLHRIV